MIKIYVLKGTCASSKSTWAKETMTKEPGVWKRVNNDDLRALLDFSAFSQENEKFLRKVRANIIKDCIKNNFNIIVDNTNISKEHFDEIVKIAEKSGAHCEISEVPFYIELDEALARNAKRTGTARVPDQAVEKFFKKLGGKAFKNYVPRTVVVGAEKSAPIGQMKQDETLPKCVIFDLDSTLANNNHRGPYDFEKCSDDKPIQYVVDLCKLYYNKGYKIFVFSGRDDSCYKQSSEWLDKYFGQEYSLHMRQAGNKEKDWIIKERLFDTHIRGKYNCEVVVDDRLSVCQNWFKMGLNLLRVGDPDSDF